MTTKPLFDKRGGYRRLHSFTFATLIHLETISFCNRFIPWQEDQLGKTIGQMIGAARSGRQNIIEGSERASTSKETEMKLTDVARASLAELLGDYEIFLADNESIPWSRESRENIDFSKILIPEYEHSPDPMHDYWEYYHEKVRPLFEPWFKKDDPIVVANCLVILIQKTMCMLQGQLKAQGDAFLQEGGFKERMYENRTTSRNTASSENKGPKCPDCGENMQKRFPRNGSRNNTPFWGCIDFPNCRGTRVFEE